MNLKDFNFPETTNAERIFSVLDADPQLLAEAKKRGFYDGQTPYNTLFNHLFFRGGTVNFKKDIDPEFRNKAWNYMKAFMGSFAPKHEAKEGICALILSELVESIE